MKRLILITIILFAGCSSAPRKPVHMTRAEIIVKLKELVNDPARYRQIEIINQKKYFGQKTGQK